MKTFEIRVKKLGSNDFGIVYIESFGVYDIDEESVKVAVAEQIGNDAVPNYVTKEGAVQFVVGHEITTFEAGEPIIYMNGPICELGIVKRRADATHYFVHYHTGDTTARTSFEQMTKLDNRYAFAIIRKSANEDDAELCPARKVARYLSGQVLGLPCLNAEAVEDVITKHLNRSLQSKSI